MELIEEISDGVATLPFNRPDRLNALSTPIMERLARSAAPTGAGMPPSQGPYDVACRASARHLAGRAQTLQDARKPMHTDPCTI